MSDAVRLRTGDSTLLPKIIEGISPEVELTPNEAGVLMTVTTKSGEKTALIPRGPQGLQGLQGIQGLRGLQGEKGDAYQLTEADIEEIKDKYDDVKADILEAAEQVAGDKAAAANSATAAANSATAAAGSATAAAQSETDAETAAENASVYKNNAAQSATEAAASASAASDNADAVQGIKTAVEALVDGFDDDAAAAVLAVTNAESDARGHISDDKDAALAEIAGKVSDAEDAATDASGSATAAAGSATEAAGSASRAASSAQEAAQIAAGIETAGAAQVAAVEAKGAEVIGSIPADYSDLDAEVGNLKSAIDDAPSEETGLDLLALERRKTEVLGIVLDEMDTLIQNLPSDEMGLEIRDKLVDTNGWLDMIYNEMVLREAV